MKNATVLCLFFTFAGLAGHLDIAAQPAQVEIPLKFGETAIPQALQGKTGLTATPQNVVTFDPTTNTIKAVKAGKETVTFSEAGQTPIVASITVAAADLTVKLTRGTDVITVTDESAPVSVVSGEQYQITLHGVQPDGTPRTFTLGNPQPAPPIVLNAATITVGAPQNEGIINPVRTAASLSFTIDDGTTHAVRFLITEAIDTLRIDAPATLRENSDVVIPVAVIGQGKGTYHSSSTEFSEAYRYDCQLKITQFANVITETRLGPASYRLSPINGNQQPEATITCSANPIGRAAVSAPAKVVKIVPAGGSIVFAPPVVNMVAGQSATIRAIVLDRSGTQDQLAKVQWSFLEPTEAAVLTPGSGNEATLLTLADPTKIPESGVLKIKAAVPSKTDATGTPLSAELVVKISTPAGFTRVSGSLELLDYQTARDLYGTQTANDFYAAKITLLNDLQDEPNRQLVGASILVFSSSLEIGVNMEKTKGEGKRPPPDGAPWEPVTFGDLRALGLPTAYPIRSQSARPNIPLPKRSGSTILSYEYDDVPVYTCDDIWFAEQDIELPETAEPLDPKAAEALRAKLIRQRNAQVAAARLRQLHYRPYPYDMVVKSFDPRDGRTTRSKTFRALTFAGAVASFITGVPNFKASDEFLAVNEKFGNVLIPALSALWPSLKETQRQNLVSDTMHPIEEIPYASSLTKVVFLPKYPFPGFKRGHWFRLSEICPYNFQVDVAVAPKGSRTTETVTPTAATP
jgi:hypothetical protein